MYPGTEGLQVGDLDLTATEMQVISLKDVVTEPTASVVSLCPHHSAPLEEAL